MNKQSQVTQVVLSLSRRARVNPIRGLDAERLAYILDQFAAGYLREAAMLWDVIERRDDMLASVKKKRVSAVARLEWEVIAMEDGRAAQKQVDALTYFYNQLQATRADDLNIRGSLAKLIAQMMDAVGKKYAVHEIVWQPGADGLTAEFRFVPLWFFENTTGNLRFLRGDGTEGVPLEPNGWLLHAGDGIMEASSVAYFFKHLPLNDWLTYCERNGMPGIIGNTTAQVGSAEWDKCAEAIAQFGAEYSALFSAGTTVVPIDLTAKGTLPYPDLIERMDRAIAILWRGADLGTMSKDNAVGVTSQNDETALLEMDDATSIAETLHEQVSKPALRYLFGEGVEPLAYLKLKVRDTSRAGELKELETFGRVGMPLSKTAIRERFTLPAPVDEEDTLHPPSAGGMPLAANVRTLLANAELPEGYADNASVELVTAMREQFGHLAQAMLDAADAHKDPEEFQARMRAIQSELPEKLAGLAETAVARAYEDITAGAFFNGLVEESGKSK